jgi:hypothetical protein
MNAEMTDLTAELRATKEMLHLLIERLDAAERRADRHRRWTRMQGLTIVAVVALGVVFFLDADDERDRICTAMRSGFDQYTEALIAVSATPQEGQPARTPEEEARREAQIELFRAETEARLAACG